ncbi:MAG: SOS response-associated peptidase [Gammaproteobacteria bacterium]|nr:SOS response-associated peptidase [Gammaproteobacteria bacterium]
MHGWTDLLGQWPEVRQSYNVAPTTEIAAFTAADSAGQAWQGYPMRWGLVPGWSKTFDSKYATFNARLESVADKPTYRHAWKHQQRCLIPMAGYYEWQQQADGSKQPFYITDRNVGCLAAAGLFDYWGSEDDRRQSCTMITRPADQMMSQLHTRMPVMLQLDDAQEWLALDNEAAAEWLARLISPDLVYWPVGPAVSNTRNNDARLIEPIDTPAASE